MKTLSGYDLLSHIRSVGMKPSFVIVYLFPVKILPVAQGFIDTALCVKNQKDELAEYETDNLRGLDIFLVGSKTDDRLRSATKILTRLASMLFVAVPDEGRLNIFKDGAWS